MSWRLYSRFANSKDQEQHLCYRKQKALESSAIRRVGLDTDARIGDDPREVFRVVKKALAVKIQKGIHVLNIAPLGEVIIDKTGVENSIGHFTRNAKTSKEHKQRVCDAFALVPDVLERDVLVEYGTQVDNDRLRSYLYVAPVTIGQETCIMAVRVRCQQKQAKRFYLHGVALLDDLKQKALEPAAVQRVGLVTDTLTGADPREVFRVVKKALAVKIQKGIHVLNIAPWGK